MSRARRPLAALGRALVRDDRIAAGLGASAARHTDERARANVLTQADVLEGARVIPAVTGTAPGQRVPTERGELVLLPGPPREMRPMLETLAAGWGTGMAPPAVLRCHGLPESDLQLAAQDVLAGRDDVELTVLARPGDVSVVLFDRGAGAARLSRVAARVAARIGDACYSTDGSTLPQVVLALARERHLTLATAESCTGGLVGAALTAVAGASESYVGGVVSYADSVKTGVLGVDRRLLDEVGAVSREVAEAMANGCVRASGADLAVAVTGIAGPGGGTADKPVGTVWFAVAGPRGSVTLLRHLPGDRETVRTGAVMTALDLLRRTLRAL